MVCVLFVIHADEFDFCDGGKSGCRLNNDPHGQLKLIKKVSIN